MCCFSQPVRRVSKTRIFARAALAAGDRGAAAPYRGAPSARTDQFLAYAMSLVADRDLAMVLPVPVPPSSPEDSVRLVDMSECPKFFEQLDVLFPEPQSRSFALAAAPAPAAAARTL